ncbi:MAG: hypothetical protein MJY44_01875 [Bacteroidales bacterium]|nr:hypothetical protein [Bacteroidales bacterium]
MRKGIFVLLAALACSAAVSCGPREVKTTFQTSAGWRPSLDNRADAVMVYGTADNGSKLESWGIYGAGDFESRLKSWRDRGYSAGFMTGIAWGAYADYFTGEWDGASHLDEGQVDMNGDTLWHGEMTPYLVPTSNFLEYMKEVHLKRVIDAGVTDIFLEEPEFWANGGYSEAFRREWRDFYGSDWRPQHESPEAAYLSGKLKYHLYYRALEEAFTFAKEYGRSRGLDVKCYVPTHSLLNYSQWRIVSPEASLALLPCVDGYIAQVWTGTSRVPCFYEGVSAERVFETAFLEYGSMVSMTAPTGRKIFFLTDPIEDGVRDWEDYKRNYNATFTAQLLYPQVADYEVMPWPERIYDGRYRVSAGSDEMSGLPEDFATSMQIMINSLNSVPVSRGRISGTPGISVLMGNSMMFQRFPEFEGYSDERFSDFYGEALPFLKRGVGIGMAHLENLGCRGAFDGIEVLLMSYSNMKPLDAKAHAALAEWVRKGGVIVYAGRDDDPYQKVMEWWNTGDRKYACPADHLFSLMGIPEGAAEGEYGYGRGVVRIVRRNPGEFVAEAGGADEYVALVADLYGRRTGRKMEFSNRLTLRRGPYLIAAVMDEGPTDEPFVCEGVMVDLYDPALPVVGRKVVHPGGQAFLFDMAGVRRGAKPFVVASSGRESDEERGRGVYSFVLKGPSGTRNVTRVYLPEAPESVTVDGGEVEPDWDERSSTCLLGGFANSPDGVVVRIGY